MRTATIALLLASISGGSTYSAEWFETREIVQDGFCPISGLGSCWAGLEASVFRNCCAPYAEVTSPSAGLAHYRIMQSELSQLNGKVLREVTLDESSKRSLLTAMGSGKDGFEIPWWVGFFDKSNALTVIEGLKHLTAANREQASRVRENVAIGGKLSLIAEVAYDGDDHPWLWKRLFYSVTVGGEKRRYYLGGAGVAIHVLP